MKPNSQAVRWAASTTGLIVVLLLVVFTASNYWSLNVDRFTNVPTSSASSRVTATAACDFAKGEWVPDPAAPYYTNATCPSSTAGRTA
jgi:putative alpha-1,2-mannosidase